MKRKSIVVYLLIAAMLLVSLAGCASSETTSEVSTESASEVSEEEVETPDEQGQEDEVSAITYPFSEGAVTLTLATSVPQFILAAADDQSISNIAAFKCSAEACGINLEIVDLGAETATEKMNIMIAGDELTDIVNSLTETYSSGAVGAIEDGIVIDIMDYAQEYAPDFYQYYISNDEYRKGVTDDEGRVANMYGSQEENYNISGLMLRGDYLTELGLETPTTYDELESVLLAMTSSYEIEYPAFFSGSVQLGTLINGYGIDSNTYSVNSNGEVVYNAATSEYKEYISMLSRWYSEGLINTDLIIDGGVSPGESNAYLANGSTVLVSGENDFLSKVSRSVSDDENYDVVPISDPTLEKDGTLRVGGDNGKVSLSKGWSISAKCQAIPEAMMYMNWFWTDEGQLVSNFGIENVAFVYDENGDPQYTDLILESEYGFAAAWRANTSFQVPSLAWYSSVEATFTDESQETCAPIWSKNRSTEGTYYGTLTTAENETVSKYATDISTLVDERIIQFVIGALDIETEWDTYLADIESLGLAECIAQYQAAYDRYLKR